MPSSFSSWPADERSTPDTRNGERLHDERDEESVPASLVATADASLDELREELAVARRRLQYYEGFAPWIEEQMAAVVDRAAEVAGESEREQARLAEEIERRAAEIERLAAERDRLREEAKTIVAEANSTAEEVITEANTAAEIVIGDANARAARLVTDAQQSAEAMVGRLRDEAAAIVGRALGDLTTLEARNAEALQAVARAHVDEPATAVALRDEPDAADSTGEWQSPPDDDSQGSAWAAQPPSDPLEATPSDSVSEPVPQDEPRLGTTTKDDRAGPKGVEEAPVVEDRPAPAPAAPQAQSTHEASAEVPPDTGPFQWLRTALAGRDASPRKDDGAEGTSRADDNDSETQDWNDAEVFVTRLVIHPAFTADERRELQKRVSGFAGVQRAGLGAVDHDFFELLVTHELFTSMLGSLLTAAGEHIRLIAQHDDSLEVEVTGLDWVREGAEAVRGLDG
jgi:cell division septum initiation protein DivIVA